MNHIFRHVRANVVAYLALFVALGGTSYAAISLPAGSVGARQLRNHSITPLKFNNSAINGSVRAWAIVGSGGKVVAGGGRPKAIGDAPYPGSYVIRWGVKIDSRCGTVATIDSSRSPITGTTPVPGNPSVPVTAGYPVAYSSGGSPSATFVNTFTSDDHLTPLAFAVTVVC